MKKRRKTKMSELTKAALERAKRTAIEYICSSIPVGTVITPAMIQNFNFNVVKWVVLAWLATGIIQVAGAFFWALKTGVPEVQPAIEATIDDVDDEPAEPYPDEDDYDDLKIDEDVDEGDYDDDLEQEE